MSNQAVQTKDKFWPLCKKIPKTKLSLEKRSLEKPILLNFVNWSKIFCPRLYNMLLSLIEKFLLTCDKRNIDKNEEKSRK